MPLEDWVWVPRTGTWHCFRARRRPGDTVIPGDRTVCERYLRPTSMTYDGRVAAASECKACVKRCTEELKATLLPCVSAATDELAEEQADCIAKALVRLSIAEGRHRAMSRGLGMATMLDDLSVKGAVECATTS